MTNKTTTRFTMVVDKGDGKKLIMEPVTVLDPTRVLRKIRKVAPKYQPGEVIPDGPFEYDGHKVIGVFDSAAGAQGCIVSGYLLHDR